MDISGRMKGSLRDFLQILFKRKIQILLFFVATVCTVSVWTYTLEPVYEATSRLLVKLGRENVYMHASGKGGPVINFDQEALIKSEIEILKSTSLAERVLESLGPATVYRGTKDKSQEDPNELPLKVRALQRDLEMKGVRKSNVIAINFKHENPQTAAAVVNKLVEFYLEYHLEVHKRPESHAFFRQQSLILRDQLRQAEEKVKDFKKQQGFTSLSEEQKLLLQQEGNLQIALKQNLSKMAETESRIRQLKIQLAATPKTIPQWEQINHNPSLTNHLEEKLVELELKEKELIIKSKYKEENRLVRNVKSEIKIVRKKLAEQKAKRHGLSSTGINTVFQQLQSELLRYEVEIKALSATMKIQSAQLREYRERIEKLNQIEMDFNLLQNQVDVHRETYRLYLTKFEESRISNAMDTEKISNVSVIEAARPPLTAVSPKVLRNLILGIFLGLFGGLGLAFLLEYLDDSMDKPEDVESTLNLPVLASVPDLRT